MKKATFTSNDSVRKPTHWRSKTQDYVMWKAIDGWNRIHTDGRVDDRHTITISPANRPEWFTPCYGDLVITISPEN